MAIAKLNREYAIRLSLVGLIMLALSFWFIYDGFVAWPRENRDLAELRPILIKGCESGVPPEIWLGDVQGEEDTFLLKKIYADHGKKVSGHIVQELKMITKPEGNDNASRLTRAKAASELFKKDVYPQSKLNSQYFMAVVMLVFAVLAFRAVLSKRGIVYEVDADGLRGNGFGDKSLSWGDIAKVDWKKWEEKGIVVVHSKYGKKYVLDGWHFAGMRPVAEEIKANFHGEENA